MAFFDFADAFPSVSIAWIFDVLVALRVPLGIRQFVTALYDQCNTFIKHNGAILFLCQVRSGVLQGCPLASLLFVLTMEPFVQLFNNFLDSQQLGRTCLCADDVGIVFKSWFDLVKVFKVFYLAERAAGLKLKPRKCF